MPVKPATKHSSPSQSKGGNAVINFFKQHSVLKRKLRQLNEDIEGDIAKTKLPFTVKEYYNFAEKHLAKDADDDLYQAGNNTYYREIITNDDELKCLQFLRQFYKSPVFCDAGCGIGNMLHFTALMGYKSFGYDINIGLQPIHKKIKADVTYGNLLEMDLTRMKKADIVYMYRPINNRNKMKLMLQLIYNNTREDVIIIYNYPHMKHIEGFETILLSNYDAHILMLVKKIAI